MDPNVSFKEAKNLICTLGYVIDMGKTMAGHPKW